ncbi:MAG: DUF1232 domain-containing protein [Candidatus Delongbacteria bacterium]|jgi:uncharacterized membrane protein YkvA (DUF1232 family)|nr:DUF1232 domain-containing protein [Candidatus Delongbacteria bacterium]
MKITEKLKAKAKSLKKEITIIYYAYQNPKTALLPKIIIFIALGYALSPIDLIPDFIPILGYLDDIIIIPTLIALSIKLIPIDILDESRKKAETHPIKLRKYWFYVLFIVFMWIVLSIVIVLALTK